MLRSQNSCPVSGLTCSSSTDGFSDSFNKGHILIPAASLEVGIHARLVPPFNSIMVFACLTVFETRVPVVQAV